MPKAAPAAAHIVTAREHGIELPGPVGLDTPHGESDSTVPDLSRSAFTVDRERRKVLCPRGAVSISWSGQVKSSGIPITRVQFAATDCRPCPLRPA